MGIDAAQGRAGHVQGIPAGEYRYIQLMRMKSMRANTRTSLPKETSANPPQNLHLKTYSSPTSSARYQQNIINLVMELVWVAYQLHGRE